MEKKYNLLYKGRKIYTNLSAEDCTEILQDLSEKYFSGEDIDPNLIEMEDLEIRSAKSTLYVCQRQDDSGENDTLRTGSGCRRIAPGGD